MANRLQYGEKIKYIGGQDEAGKKMYELEDNKEYTVGEECTGNFNGVMLPCVYLVEVGKKCAFLLSMFEKV